MHCKRLAREYAKDTCNLSVWKTPIEGIAIRFTSFKKSEVLIIHGRNFSTLHKKVPSVVTKKCRI